MMVAASIAHSGWVTYIAPAFHLFYYTILAYFYIFLFSDLHVFISDHRYQKCVYTYRILPSEDKKLSVQVGEQLNLRNHSP